MACSLCCHAVWTNKLLSVLLSFFSFFAFSEKSQLWARRAWCECTSVSLSSSRQSLTTTLLLCKSKQPSFSTKLLQGSREEVFPWSVCWEQLAKAGRSLLWPYYFHLLNTIRFPTQGGKRKRRRRIVWCLWCSHSKVCLSTPDSLWGLLWCDH